MSWGHPLRSGARESLRGGGSNTFLGRSSMMLGDNQGDPMEAMGNLFDVATLIGVGFMIVAFSSFGLRELLTKDTVTIVKNPGAADMEIISKKGDTIQRLKAGDRTASGIGSAIGTVYRLKSGEVVWVPGGPEATP